MRRAYNEPSITESYSTFLIFARPIFSFTQAITGDDEEEKSGTVKVRHEITDYSAMTKTDYQKAVDIALKEMNGISRKLNWKAKVVVWFTELRSPVMSI